MRTWKGRTSAARVGALIGLLVAVACSEDVPVAATSASPEPATPPASAVQSAGPRVVSSTTAVWVTPPPSATATEAASSATASASESAVASASVAPSVSGAPNTPVAVTGLQDKLDALLKSATNGVLPKGAADKIIKPGGKPLIAVLDDGKDAKKELKYDLQAKAKESVVLSSDMSMKMSAGAGGPSQAMTLPQMTMTLEMATADQKESNGDMKLSGKLADVTVAEGATPLDKKNSEAMREALTSLKGLGISYFVNAKGWSHDVQIKVPEAATPQGKVMAEQLKQSFESMMAPLPDGPVGDGGKWVVVTRIAGAADAIQWTTYTLKRRDGNVVEIEAVSTQLAAGSTMGGPGMPVAANINSFKSGGSGSTTTDLKKIFPESGAVSTNSAADISSGDKSMTIETTAKVKFSHK